MVNLKVKKCRLNEVCRDCVSSYCNFNILEFSVPEMTFVVIAHCVFVHSHSVNNLSLKM